jgi:hypothetical protein
MAPPESTAKRQFARNYRYSSEAKSDASFTIPQVHNKKKREVAQTFHQVVPLAHRGKIYAKMKAVRFICSKISSAKRPAQPLRLGCLKMACRPLPRGLLRLIEYVRMAYKPGSVQGASPSG